MDLNKRILRAAKGTVLLRIALIFLTLAGTVLLARILGPEKYGIYAFVLAAVNIMAIPAQAGLPALIVRETASAHLKNNWAKIKGLWHWAVSIVAYMSIALAVVFFIILLFLGDSIDQEMKSALYAGVLILPLIAMGDIIGAALRGLRHVIAGQLGEAIIRPALIIILVWAFSLAMGELTASAALIANAAGAGTALIIGIYLIQRVRSVEYLTAKPDRKDIAIWKRAILPLALLNSVQIVNAQVGVLLMGFFRPENEVGLYKIAASTAALTAFGLQVANIVVQPHIARLYADGQLANLQQLSSRAALAATCITAPAVLILLLAGKPLLRVLFGADFEGAWLPLVILSLGQLTNAIFGSVALLLSMTGHEKDSFRWLAIAAAFNVFLSLVLVPILGMNGAAIAYSLSIVFWNIAFWHVAKKRIDVDGSIFPLIVKTMFPPR